MNILAAGIFINDNGEISNVEEIIKVKNNLSNWKMQTGIIKIKSLFVKFCRKKSNKQTKVIAIFINGNKATGANIIVKLSIKKENIKNIVYLPATRLKLNALIKNDLVILSSKNKMNIEIILANDSFSIKIVSIRKSSPS